jgi:heat shock protein HslJ
MDMSLQRLAFLVGALGLLSACAMAPSPPSASPPSASPPSASPPALPSQTGAWRPPQAASLLGSRWKLVALQSMDDAQGTVRPDAPERYTLHFESATRVAVRLDCNRGAGSWTWEPGPSTQAGEPVRGGLRLGAIALTRMACPPGSLDGRIGRQLEFVRGFVLDGDRLTLSLMADGGLLHFMRE